MSITEKTTKSLTRSAESIQRDHDMMMLGDYLSDRIGSDLARAVQAGETPVSWLIIRALSELIEELGKLEAKPK